MPINRTTYNALVDDDGTGTTGSVWDKADIKDVILDPVDAMFEESGIWTPVLRFGGATTGITYSAQSGSYTRIGNFVFLEMRLALSSKGTATGIASITGMPFTAVNTPGAVLDCNAGMVNLVGATFVVVSGSSLFPVYRTSTGRTSLTNAEFTDTSDIRCGIGYRKSV